MNELSLDPAHLENVKPQADGSIKAACPACRASDSDKSGEHLKIDPSGKFGCAKHPGDKAHRQEIFKLAGNRNSTPDQKPRIVQTYDYTDAARNLLFQVCRLDPKSFRQRRPDPKGGWIWNMDGVERVLFRLPEIIAAKTEGRPVYVAEGEKDCLALVDAGFVATCNPGGSGKWLDSYSETLSGLDVVIIADKDVAGRAHAQLVASKLHGVAKSVRVIELADTNGKAVKDAADYFAAGEQAAELDEIAQAAPEWTPQAAKDPLPGNEDAPEDATPQLRDRPLPEIIDAAVFIACLIKPPAELIAGILHKGSKLAFGGSSKSFKTWCLLYLALCVATGADWLGRATQQGKVLFVNFEIQSHAWQRRLIAVAQAIGINLQAGQIHLWNLRGHAADFRQLIPRIIERCRTENFALIVLDPIYKLYGGTDENAAGDVAALLNEIERLTTETGAAVAFGAHFAKGNASAKEAIDRISGSGVFARDPDSLLIFTKHEDDDAFVIEPILRDFAPVAPFVVRWEFPLMRLADDLDPAKLKQSAGRKKGHDPKQLLAIIANNDRANPISVSEWARLAEIPRKTLADYLAEMRRNNWIETIGEGMRAKQAITNEGKAFISK